MPVPDNCTMPDGNCNPILEEYADAVRLLHRMRKAANPESCSPVLHWYLPAGQISADLFCTASHPGQGWYCLMADVSGHGLVPSLFALHVPMLFRESVLLGMSLPAIYERISSFLNQQHICERFVSGILVRIRDREIEIINAGMPDALLFAADGQLGEVFPSTQLPFGIGSGHAKGEVTPQRYRLVRQDTGTLLMYSDGLSELGCLEGLAKGQAGIHIDSQGRAKQLYEWLIDSIGKRVQQAHDDISMALIPIPFLPVPQTDTDESGANQFGIDSGDQLDLPLQEATALHVIEHIDYGLILTDADQRMLYVNPAFTAITGYSLAECRGQTPRLLSSGRHHDSFYRDMWQTLQEQGNWYGEIWNRRKDGSLYLEWLDIQAIRDEQGKVKNYLATFTDIMRMREKDDRLYYMAMHDPLTGLANRVLLTDRGQQAIRRVERSERSLAILFIDLDRFKTINDSLGHDVGDEVLVSVAQRLSQSLREDDTLARFGGDQFVCLLPDIESRQDALMVANKLLRALDIPVVVAGHQFKVGASIGISAYPSDSLTFDDLLVEADRAMISAKQAGGNLVRFFTAEMSAKMDRQLEMEARLDAAIKAGELVLYYQPKVDLATRCIVGAEALVRWQDPRSGLVPPSEFIPVAERSDLIAKIGHWVLQEACRMIARQDAGFPDSFNIAINVSPKQFERGDLAAEVATATSEAGVMPGRLQLEVTESIIIRDANRVASTLQDIADMGVSIALDDFGTGYSNLASLSRLPIDTFKLDQSFVRDVSTNSCNASIARSVWHLADGLGKNVVAEGVESCDECIKLMSMGYRLAQGYRFGKPMPENEFLHHLDNWDPGAYHCLSAPPLEAG